MIKSYSIFKGSKYMRKSKGKGKVFCKVGYTILNVIIRVAFIEKETTEQRFKRSESNKVSPVVSGRRAFHPEQRWSPIYSKNTKETSVAGTE